MQAERQHFRFAFVVTCTECYQAGCYECIIKPGYNWNPKSGFHRAMLRRARHCQFAIVCRLSVRPSISPSVGLVACVITQVGILHK